MSAHEWPEFELHPTYNESYGDIQISKSEYNRARACVNKLAAFTIEEIESGIDICALKQQNAALQAKIDALMLEYCPDEMTGAQLKTWGDAQKVSETPFCHSGATRP